MKLRKHIMIPDLQIRPGVEISHLNALGNYIVDQKPDIIIQIGDFADMHSLSSYDTGKKAGEGARYAEDLAAAQHGMKVLMQPIWDHQNVLRNRKKKLWDPKKVITLGNHENRITRHVNAYPYLSDYLDVSNLDFVRYGWDVYDFLEVVQLDGVSYSHYFPRNATGRIVQTHRGAPSARMQVQREGRSCTSGHLQGLDFHIQQRHNRRDYGLIAGSFYMHEEDYLGPQGTAYWKGVVVKHQVQDGQYDAMFVSLDYLMREWWDGKVRYANESD